MNTPIVLQRQLSVRGFRVTGSIAFASRREWEPAVAKLAVQHGAITPELVVRDLLGGRTGVAKRLLDICTNLGLLESQRHGFVPTPAGHATAANGLVLIPERGTWTIWACEDPLLSSPIVAIESWREPSAFEDRGRDSRRSITQLPSWLTATLNRVCEPLAGDHRAMRIDDLGKEQKGEAVDRPRSLRLTLSITPSDVRARVTGDLGGAVDADLRPPAVSHETVWAQLLQDAGLADRWDAHRRALWVAFKDTSPAQRASVERAIRFERPELPGLGRFDATTIERVPLRPWSTADAAEWAVWRLLESLGGYAFGDALEVAYQRAAAPFADLAPPCPSRAALADRVRGADRPPPAFWRLQAPADWALAQGGLR